MDVSIIAKALQENNKLKRRKALSDLKCCLEENENYIAVFQATKIPLLACLSEDSEVNRTKSCELFVVFIKHGVESSLISNLIFPVLYNRLGTSPILETCEENRVEFIKLIECAIDNYAQKLELFYKDICTILKNSLKDNFADVIVNTCLCIEKLALVSGTKFQAFSNKFTRPLISCLNKHKWRIRATVINTLGFVFVYGDCQDFEELNHNLKNCIWDIPQVRFSLLQYGFTVCEKLKDRYSYWHVILPLVLFGLRDSDAEIRDKALLNWKKIGLQYESENKDFFSTNVFDLCENTVDIGLDTSFNTGCCELLSQNFHKMQEEIFKSMKSWREEERLQGIKLLSVCIIGLKRNCVQYSNRIIGCLVQTVHGADFTMTQECKLCCEVLGQFVPPDLYVALLAPYGENEGAFTLFSCLVQTTPEEKIRDNFSLFCEMLSFGKIRKINFEFVLKELLIIFERLLLCCDFDLVNDFDSEIGVMFLSILFVNSWAFYNGNNEIREAVERIFNKALEKGSINEVLEKGLIKKEIKINEENLNSNREIEEYLNSNNEIEDNLNSNYKIEDNSLSKVERIVKIVPTILGNLLKNFDNFPWVEENNSELMIFLYLSYFKGFSSDLETVRNIMKLKITKETSAIVLFKIFEAFKRILVNISLEKNDQILLQWILFHLKEHIIESTSLYSRNVRDSFKAAILTSLINVVRLTPRSCLQQLYKELEPCIESQISVTRFSFVESKILSCELVSIFIEKFAEELNNQKFLDLLKTLSERLEDENVHLRKIASQALKRSFRVFFKISLPNFENNQKLEKSSENERKLKQCFENNQKLELKVNFKGKDTNLRTNEKRSKVDDKSEGIVGKSTKADDKSEEKIVEKSTKANDKSTEIVGKSTKVGDKSGEVVRKSTKADDKSEEIVRKSTKADDKSEEKIVEKSTKAEDKSTEIVGKLTKVDDKSGEVVRKSTKVDNKSKEMVEKSTKADDKTEEIVGKSTKADNKFKEIVGKSTKVDDKSEEIVGQSTKVDNKSEEIVEKSTKVDDKSEEIVGKSTKADNKFKEIVGKSTKIDDKSEEIVGKSTKVDDKSEEIVGKSTEIDDFRKTERKSAEIVNLKREDNLSEKRSNIKLIQSNFEIKFNLIKSNQMKPNQLNQISLEPNQMKQLKDIFESIVVFSQDEDFDIKNNILDIFMFLDFYSKNCM